MAQLENLNSEEKATLVQLKMKMKNAISRDMYKDDMLFYRFLKARDFDIIKGELMLRKHIEFRKVMGVDTILEDFVPAEVYVNYIQGSYIGEDKDSCPVIYLPLGKMDSRDVNKCFKMNNYLKHWIWNAERYEVYLKESSAKVGRPISKVSFIIDADELQLANALHPSAAAQVMKVAEMLQDNYPERGKIYLVINAPAFYVGLFSIVKRILAAEVLKKIHIFGKTGWKEELLKIIDAEVLPAFLGGSRTDPDGNPMCETFITHPKRIPSKYYLSKEDRSFRDKSRIKQITVSPGTSSEVFMEVKNYGSVIHWEYEVAKRDIGFGLFFRESNNERKEILPIYRFETTDGTENGSYKCQSIGTYIIVFDNTYSWLHTKAISYCISVTEPKIS